MQFPNLHLNKNGYLTISMYDLAGHMVYSLYEGTQAEGSYSIEINAKEFSSGLYFIYSEFYSGSSIKNETMKINLLK